uniref:Uncharacterized protein n=1 Tax=uncultured bacterium contig00031 TaxID=1181520 RepID=A0A806KJB9_9BACT|nr:hypothetical protein [uncultured bacterium contig00031]
MTILGIECTSGACASETAYSSGIACISGIVGILNSPMETATNAQKNREHNTPKNIGIINSIFTLQ